MALGLICVLKIPKVLLPARASFLNSWFVYAALSISVQISNRHLKSPISKPKLVLSPSYLPLSLPRHSHLTCFPEVRLIFISVNENSILWIAQNKNFRVTGFLPTPQHILSALLVKHILIWPLLILSMATIVVWITTVFPWDHCNRFLTVPSAVVLACTRTSPITYVQHGSQRYSSTAKVRLWHSSVPNLLIASYLTQSKTRCYYNSPEDFSFLD